MWIVWNNTHNVEFSTGGRDFEKENYRSCDDGSDGRHDVPIIHIGG